jgi:hypothetical protein
MEVVFQLFGMSNWEFIDFDDVPRDWSEILRLEWGGETGVKCRDWSGVARLEWGGAIGVGWRDWSGVARLEWGGAIGVERKVEEYDS